MAQKYNVDSLRACYIMGSEWKPGNKEFESTKNETIFSLPKYQHVAHLKRICATMAICFLIGSLHLAFLINNFCSVTKNFFLTFKDF